MLFYANQCWCNNQQYCAIAECAKFDPDDKCECYKTFLESKDPEEKAYAYYYNAVLNCSGINLETKKQYLNRTRTYWDSINYNGHRYLYSYKFLIEDYKVINKDSAIHYMNKLLDVKHDNSHNSQQILRGELHEFGNYQLKFGDVYEVKKYYDNFLNSDNYKNFTPYNKASSLAGIARAYGEINDVHFLNLAIEKYKDGNNYILDIIDEQDEQDRIYFIILLNYNNFGIGFCYEKLGKYEEALEKFENYYQFNITRNDSTAQANTANSIAELYYKKEQFNQALEWSTISIDLYQKVSDKSLNYSPNHTHGKSLLALEKLDLAKKSYLEGLQISLGTQYAASGFENILISETKNPDYTIKYLIELAKTELAYYNNEHKASIGLSKKYINLAYTLLHDLIEKQNSELSSYDFKSISEDVFKLSNHLYLIEGNSEELFYNINKGKNSIFQHKLEQSDKNPDSLNEFLKTLDHSSILQFAQANDSLISVVYQNSEFKTYKHGSINEASKLLQKYNNQLDKPDSNESFNQTSNEIYSFIFNKYPKLNQNLIIIPDHNLSSLNFSSLLKSASDAKSYILHDYNISYQLSANLFKAFTERKYETKSVSTFAPIFEEKDIAYTSMTRSMNENEYNFNELRFATKESSDIAELWRGKFLEAEKEAIFSSLENDAIFHFSGHAYTLNFDPDKSFILLNSLNNSDSKIYASEIKKLKCNNELIVLSACDSGRGKIIKFEGVLSQARAYFQAGAKSVVSTLWSVNDRSSSIIMTDFHKHLKAGMRKDEALRQAKLDYLEKADPEYQHPYYWAGFVAAGDMSPLAYPLRKWYWIGGTILALLFAGGIGYFNKKKTTAHLAA